MGGFTGSIPEFEDLNAAHLASFAPASVGMDIIQHSTLESVAQQSSSDVAGK